MSLLTHLKQEAVFRTRFTRAGRGLVRTAMAAAHPLDWYGRRRAAARYNATFPSSRMTAASGYAIVPAGHLPGTPDVVDTCRRLFEHKLAQLEAAPPSGKRGGKGSFLKNLLNDEDLRTNPILVDFALSDALFSIVTNYLSMIPTLHRVDLLYSIPRPNPEQLISSQLFHQDHEGLNQAKLFLNIFDVTEEHGPFTLIPSSDSERLLMAIRQERRQAGAPVEGHYGDEEIRAHGGLAVTVSLTGPAGTAAVIDTCRCLHSGSRVLPGRFRLCLYIQYCTSREKANTFDAARFRKDPVRWLALERHAGRSGSASY